MLYEVITHFARAGQGLGAVAAMEDEGPGSARPLERVHADGLFEGVVRHRRPMQSYNFV